jgi:hypothetical protein
LKLQSDLTNLAGGVNDAGNRYDIWIAHMGNVFVKGLFFQRRLRPLAHDWRSWSEPVCAIWLKARTNSHSVVAFERRTLIPLSAARAREGGTILRCGF